MTHVSELKAQVYAIANRHHLDVDSYFLDGCGDKRSKSTWEAAFAMAIEFEADFNAAAMADNMLDNPNRSC